VIEINGRAITVTRGDCLPFTITLTGSDVPPDGESVLFTVKEDATSAKPVIEKRLEVENSKVLVTITNADTKQLPFGNYEWDIRFPDMSGDGEPYTPMKPEKFTIARVIGNV